MKLEFFSAVAALLAPGIRVRLPGARLKYDFAQGQLHIEYRDKDHVLFDNHDFNRAAGMKEIANRVIKRCAIIAAGSKTEDKS